jgi:hypothetical protein
MNEQHDKARRNVLLFWAHIALAAFFVAWFVYAVVSK